MSLLIARQGNAWTISASDSVTVADAAARTASLHAADAVTPTDATSGPPPGPGGPGGLLMLLGGAATGVAHTEQKTIGVGRADGATITDIRTLSMLPGTPHDTVVATDAITVQASSGLSLADTVSVGDEPAGAGGPGAGLLLLGGHYQAPAVQRTISVGKGAADTVTAADAHTVDDRAPHAETAAVTDHLTLARGLGLPFDETITVDDAIDVLFNPASHLTINIEDTATAGDQASLDAGPGIDDAVSIVETFQLDTNHDEVTLGDEVAVSDDVTIGGTAARTNTGGARRPIIEVRPKPPRPTVPRELTLNVTDLLFVGDEAFAIPDRAQTNAEEEAALLALLT